MDYLPLRRQSVSEWSRRRSFALPSAAALTLLLLVLLFHSTIFGGSSKNASVTTTGAALENVHNSTLGVSLSYLVWQLA